MRDKLKSEDYFQEYLKKMHSRIEKFEDVTNEVTMEKGYNDEGALNGLYTLQGLYLNEIRALYSFEGQKYSLHEFLVKFIEISYNFRSPLTYDQIMDSISLTILLDDNNREIHKLVPLIEIDNPNDYLIDFLLHSQIDFTITHSEFKFPIPYGSLKDVISLSEDNQKDKAVVRLKEYLDKEWYKGHSDSGWYDNHKSKHNTYSGYWSWESGALVKILGLDDTILKNQQYYPYDMVHWQD